MKCELFTPGVATPEQVAARLRERVAAGESVAAQVSEIIRAVRIEGDAAVEDFTRRFDTSGASPPPVVVPAIELERAVRELAPDVRFGLEATIENVGRVATACVQQDRTVTFDDHEVVLREAPVRRAAVYAPGGRAPYPSSVVMGVVTARAAGVRDVTVCTPPARDGMVNQAVLAVCRLSGADEVLRIGGAQAIAALAYGTETIMPADVIVGPGNLWVQEAKRQVSGQVGIDAFAGPSDLVVIVDGDSAVEPVALDLLAQAEHGTGSIVVAVSVSIDILVALEERFAAEEDTGAVVGLVQVLTLGDALAFAEAFAPEHLQLIGTEARELAHCISRTGCLFVGAKSATALGDYIAGSNHTLPTGGTARFASALGPQHFRRSFCEVRIYDASTLARKAAPIARCEGFEFHARSMEARIQEPSE